MKIDINSLKRDGKLLEFTGHQQSQFIISKSETADETIARIANGGATFGDEMPWQKTHDNIRFRPAEVTLWAGVNGNGKSLVTSQVALHLSAFTNVLLASMEMHPSATMARMVKQAAGCKTPTEAYVRAFLNWRNSSTQIYDLLDTVPAADILSMIHYAANELGIRHFFIDSLVKCGIGLDNYNGQRDFVSSLSWIAKETQTHIHLVHHMRKGEREAMMPDKFDVKGAGEIVDLVDNLIIVHRNKGKEEKIARLKAKAEMVPEDLEKSPDTFLKVAKQRHHNWEGLVGLYYRHDSEQFVQGYHDANPFIDLRDMAAA